MKNSINKRYFTLSTQLY